MKYQINFSYQNGGVWAMHQTEAAAQNHINMLVEMTPGNKAWEITYEGKVLKRYPEKPLKNS